MNDFCETCGDGESSFAHDIQWCGGEYHPFHSHFENSCDSCDDALTPENTYDDPQARFWLGDEAPKYCVTCAEHLAEAQAERAFNLLYAS